MKIENPAFDYDTLGQGYSGQRQTDFRIAKYIHDALGDAKSVINVGAGAGSYEPQDRYVIAVEPSSTMRLQRKKNLSPAINAKADHIPFDDDSFDAAMALLTVHHWPDMKKGLSELRRVAKKRVVVMTYDPEKLDVFWNINYFPELIEVEKARYPKIDFIVDALGGNCEIINVPIPLDCVDGFQEAFYGRPEAFLNKKVRDAQSAWSFLTEDVIEKQVNALRKELVSGDWERKYGHYRTQPFFEGALRLVVAK